MSFAKALQKGRALLTPRGSYTDAKPTSNGEFSKVSREQLFPKVDAAIDGIDCDHDCASCEYYLPRGFDIEEKENIYDSVKGFATHIIIATGKSDWVKHAEDEKGSVMQAIAKSSVQPANGVMKVSASNIPLPDYHDKHLPPADRATTILILPTFTFIDNVTPGNVDQFISEHVSTISTFSSQLHSPYNDTDATAQDPGLPQDEQLPTPGKSSPANSTQDVTLPMTPSPFTTRRCLHRYLILLCSQRSRDARCGQSAPILKREFERHLRPRGLYRDFQDDRPGGVGIYFVDHVGGHKWSANVLVYRREEDGQGQLGEAKQLIFLGRVRPEECEGVIKYTVLQGKVVKPERQLRGGFDREKGLLSW